MNHPRLLKFLPLLLILLAACQSGGSDPTPTPSPVPIVWQLATVGPTPTLSDEQRQATRQSAQLFPTNAPPTQTPTITPYIGQFLGEVDISDLNRPFSAETPFVRATQPSAVMPIVCAIPPSPVFGTNWERNSRALNSLRCPIQESFGYNGRVLIFERGVMYWRPETNEVWAITPTTPLATGKYWYIDQPLPISTQGRNAPEGLLIPEGTFGAAWLTVPQVTTSLGFAVTPDQAVDVNLQRFEGGTLFLDITSGQVFALLVNGDAIGPIDRGDVPDLENSEA